jgi:hypothetical protein
VAGFGLRFPRVFAGILAALACAGCSSSETPPEVDPKWTFVHEDLDGALISVWGTTESDVWAVGADTGDGPLVLHWDGERWEELETGARTDLYWVFGFAGGPVFLGGTNGVILAYADGAFTPMTTPGTGTVYGIWGSALGDVWAVGGDEGGGSGAFAWRLSADTWLPAQGFPADLNANKAIWKVWGSGPDDVWLVGSAGIALHFDGARFATENLGGGESLFTVHYAAGRFAAVGGFATGLVFENTGAGWEATANVTLPGLVGVYVTETGGYAVGNFGSFVERHEGTWRVASGPETSETLHAIWRDPSGGLWTVGGQVQARPLVRGLLAYRGARIPKGDER